MEDLVNVAVKRSTRKKIRLIAADEDIKLYELAEKLVRTYEEMNPKP